MTGGRIIVTCTIITFLPARRYARAVLAVIACSSVRPSLACIVSINTAKPPWSAVICGIQADVLTPLPVPHSRLEMSIPHPFDAFDFSLSTP